MHRILVINPGSTTTKLALYENENPIWLETIAYSSEKLFQFKKISDQLDLRQKDITTVLKQKKFELSTLNAVSARGGPFKPLKGGTYRIGDAVLKDVLEGRVLAEHVSNLGVLLADGIARPLNIAAFFVDPVSVDEFEPVARITGFPELERKSLLHALNIKASARALASELGKNFDRINFLAAHLGGGISICAIRSGRIVDVLNANEEGPFSPERAGSLPMGNFTSLCYSGQFTQYEMKRKLISQSGLIAHLGTHDAREVENRIRSGDAKAKLVFQALAYQIAKGIGSLAAVLHGKVDAILLTGGLANSSMLVEWISEKISFLSPVHVYPGEREMEALALGVLRILKGEEREKNY